MGNNIKCGEYRHFKGKRYKVYGVALDDQSQEYVLYQQNYGEKTFWIRRVSMFLEELDYNSKKVQRFELLKEVSPEIYITNLATEFKKQSSVIFHSETEQQYRLFCIDTETKKILIVPYDSFSTYLTDTQLAWRMGYDLYKIDNVKYIYPSPNKVSFDKKLVVEIENNLGSEYNNKTIIEDMNPCSIDLHISDRFFYKPKRKTIDIASMMRFSVKATDLWKIICLKKRNGFESVVLYPGKTIITRTLEKIKLPNDCAGKIEIKSTYARLALSVTASDFCNPGWKGYFPLSITNNGKHTIILHPEEQMLQLSLVQTDGIIINEYSSKATYMNDDGTPFKFWHAQTVKKLQKERFSNEILSYYENVLNEICPENAQNPDEARKRFEDTFLLFCERKLKSQKYNTIRDPKFLLRKIWEAYRRKENARKWITTKAFKVSAFIIAFIPSVIWTCVEWVVKKQLDNSVFLWLGISLVVAIVVEVILYLVTPNCFCTLEKLEFDKIYKKNQ